MVKGGLRIVAGIPAALLFAMLTQALHLYLLLGRRARSVLDNPDGLAFELHDMLVQILLLLSLAAPISWLALALIWRSRLNRKEILRQLGAILAGYALIVALFAFDPTGYVEWFLD